MCTPWRDRRGIRQSGGERDGECYRLRLPAAVRRGSSQPTSSSSVHSSHGIHSCLHFWHILGILLTDFEQGDSR